MTETGPHSLGAPFRSVTQLGIRREECLAELPAFTHEKNIPLRTG